MKKKILTILLIAAMGLMAASCGKKADNKGGSTGGSSNDASTSASTQKEYSPGSHDGSLYTNEFFGISMTLGDFIPYTDEQIKQLAEQSGATSSTTYDFVVVSSDNSANVNVVSEKLTKLAAMNDAEEILKSQAGLVEKQLATYNASVSMTEVKFCGKTHPAMLVAVDGFTEVMVCLKQGDYAGYITATASDQAGAQAVLDMFTAL